MRLVSLAIAFVTLASASCSAVPPSPPAAPTVGAGVPSIRFDRALLNNDHTVLRIEFTGGPEYRPDDPCSTAYDAVATGRDGTLEVAVIDVTPIVPQRQEIACPMSGHPRQIDLILEAPFDGTAVRDVAGYLHFVRPPAGLVELAGLPGDWSLRAERSVEESPTGRWARTYSPDELPAAPERTLELYQSFDGPVQVSGGEEVSQVEVGASSATLYRQAASGELVLVWAVDGDGLALVAYEHEWPVDKLLELAESAGRP